MARFVQTAALDIAPVSGKWVTARPVIYWSDVAGRIITVPMFFETDLASIPALVRPLIPVNGQHRNAAVLHDYLYQKCGCWCSRKLADEIFREAMRVLGESAWRREAMYRGVRIGGWLHYQSCKNGDDNGVRM